MATFPEGKQWPPVALRDPYTGIAQCRVWPDAVYPLTWTHGIKGCNHRA